MNKTIREYLEKAAKKQMGNEESSAKTETKVSEESDTSECQIECREEVEAVARLVMSELEQLAEEDYVSKERFLNLMETVWEKQDEGDYVMAYDLLTLFMLVTGADSRHVISRMIYPCKARSEYFMDYFCEVLIDELILGGEIDEHDEFECDCDL